jgi:hypothetical protein
MNFKERGSLFCPAVPSFFGVGKADDEDKTSIKKDCLENKTKYINKNKKIQQSTGGSGRDETRRIDDGSFPKDGSRFIREKE